MSPSTNNKPQVLSLGYLGKTIILAGLFFFILFAFLCNQPYRSFDLRLPSFQETWLLSSPVAKDSPTNISHIMFVVAGSTRIWKRRKPYVEAWWRENITRGNIWLEIPPTKEFLPWPPSSPPFRVNEDVNKVKGFPKLLHPNQIRMYRSILETFRLGDSKDVRWYVMADDDTLLFVDNLVEMLSKYDHTEYYYIGGNSEVIKSNADFSFHMGYGGAAYALSYPLVEALASKIDDCVKRYQHLFVMDYISHSCLADLGVDLTIEKGHHQIDLRGDISGFLSYLPSPPLITLHHFDIFDPIFPSMSRTDSMNHLMKAGNVDQSRLLQQTIGYHNQTKWTFSTSWGYSIHVYENTFPRSIIRKPLETFKTFWKDNVKPPLYMFNTRLPKNDSCETPHVFFLDTVEIKSEGGHVVTTYTRRFLRNLPPCSLNGNHSADPISKIQVFSPANRRKKAGRIECCDVEYVIGKDIADVKIRDCKKDEMMA